MDSQDTQLLKVIKPRNLHETQIIFDLLQKGFSVVVNLEEVPEDELQPVRNFIRQTAFYSNCEMQKVSEEIFLFVPADANYTVEVKEVTKLD